MANRNYRKGANLEYLVRDELIARGYAVTRSAGSKGPIDLVATSEDDVLFIQVKAEKQTRPGDVEKLLAVPVPSCAHLEIWERKKTGRTATWKVTRLT